MPTGVNVHHIGGQGHRPLPLATGPYRDAHKPQTRKPSGLDWSALSPTCSDCGAKSMDVNVDTLQCPACSPAATTPTPVAAGPSSAAGTGGGSSRQPTRGPRTTEGDGRRSHVDRDAIVRLYTSGLSVPKVRAELGYAFGTIRRALADAGVELRDDRKSNGPKARQPKPPHTGPVTDTGRAVRRDRIVLDTDAVVAAYKAGDTLTKIAADLGCSHPVVARTLDAAGVVRRGSPLRETPEQVAEVRRLYVDEQLTQAEVAERMGLSCKGVQNIMSRHDIASRPAAHLGGLPGVDRAAGLKQRIADLGVTARDIKEWALRQGLIYEISVGIPAARLVDAYAEAHAQQEAS